MLKVRNAALEWTQVMRSNDIFRGLPYNFVQFTTMQEIMAGWLNLKVGSYNHFSDSLHIYERDFGQLKAPQPVKINDNTDSLVLPRAEFDLVFADLEYQATRVADETVTSGSLVRKIEQCTLPAAYRNILRVLYAEGGRKRQHCEAIEEIMAGCSNPAYQQLYARWLSRFSDATARTGRCPPGSFRRTSEPSFFGAMQ
jgi:thymidylate synthase